MIFEPSFYAFLGTADVEVVNVLVLPLQIDVLKKIPAVQSSFKLQREASGAAGF